MLPTDEGIVLDQFRYAVISMVLKGMGSTEVGKWHIPLDLGVGLSVRKEQEGEFDVSRFTCARNQGRAMLLAEW